MKSILKTAENFILQQKKENSIKWSEIEMEKEIKNVFWWNSKLKLYDIPLINRKTKKREGYILVSESKDLPPIIEYSTEGLSLKEQIDTNIDYALNESKIRGIPFKYYFMNSTEIYVEIEDEVHANNFVLNIPNLFVVEKQSLEKFNQDRDPKNYFTTKTTRDLWYYIENNEITSQSSKILNWKKPIRYQQNCDSYSAKEICFINLETPQHFCSPRAISGCTPIAWAMLLSSWKKSFLGNANTKIWKNSNCWDLEWPSYARRYNPSQCSVVESTIWQIGEYMSTTRNGETYLNQIINGSKIFSDFDLQWKFHRAANQTFEWAVKIIDAGQTFMFGGTGEWSFNKKTFLSSDKFEESGHSTVAYGYNKSNRQLLVALGWGTSYSNKWVNHDQYRNRGHTYLVGKTKKSTSIEPLIINDNNKLNS